MAFDRNPIVDNNSERSEESVLKCKVIFSRKNGFISREEIPDYGVDLDIELINENSEASGKKFPVQIKSTKSIKKVNLDGIDYTSLQFKTSRLGYLARRIPGHGLIILYCENDNNLYFDYTEKIILRIQKSREDDNWKNQKTVNIHIPMSNVLDEKSIINVYEKFVLKFENFAYFLDQYNNITKEENKESQKFQLEELEEFGSALINNQEFKLLQDVLSLFTAKEIVAKPKVCLYAALTYSETGYAIESIYYLYKCKKFKKEYSDAETELLQIVEIKVKFLLGELSFDEYGAKALDLSRRLKSPLNRVNLNLNLLKYKFTNVLSGNKFNKKFELELLSFFDELEKLKIDEEKKSSLIVQHCQTTSNYAISYYSHIFVKNKIREKLGGKLSNSMKVEALQRYFTLLKKAENYLKVIYDLSIKNDNLLLESEVLLTKARIFFTQNFNQFMIRQVNPLSTELKDSYEWHGLAFLRAYNGFVKYSRLKEAHLALNFALDLNLMFQLVYSENIEAVIVQDIKKIASNIEHETGLNPYESVVEEALKNTLFLDENDFNKFSKEMPIEKLEQLARELIVAKDLPEDRYVNVINDLLTYRKFHRLCDNPYVELLQDLRHTFSIETHYKNPCKYIIKNKKSGIETPPSESIDELIKLYGLGNLKKK